MKRVLHILKESPSEEALDLIRRQALKNSEEQTILLIQDAVRLNPDVSVPMLVLEEDAKRRSVSTGYERVDYEKMLDLILSHDAVMMW